MISRNIDIVFIALLLAAAAVFSSVKQHVLGSPVHWNRTIISAPMPPQAPVHPRVLFE